MILGDLYQYLWKLRVLFKIPWMHVLCQEFQSEGLVRWPYQPTPTIDAVDNEWLFSQEDVICFFMLLCLQII